MPIGGRMYKIYKSIERGINVVNAVSAIIAAISAVALIIQNISSWQAFIAKPIYFNSFLLSASVLFFAIGINIILKYFATQDQIYVDFSKIEVTMLDSGGENSTIYREKCFIPVKKNVRNIFEGTPKFDGKVKSMELHIYELDKLNKSAKRVNEIQVDFPYKELFLKGDYNDVEYAFDTSLKKGKPYLLTSNLELQNSFIKSKEYYGASVNCITREAEVIIKSHENRPFIPEKARAIQTKVEGLSFKQNLENSHFESHREFIKCAIRKPRKGDAIRILWEW